MDKFVSTILIAVAFAYTLIVSFIVLFTIGFFGLEDLGKNLIGLIVFCLIALSPLAVWPYCLRRAAAWRRGEHPPF
ncbi:MAG: hypothetical protein PGN12_00900 [Sphingomonas phyllosphaerae]